MSPHPISRLARGAALTALLLAALPSVASADTRIATNAVTDPSGGATVTAEVWKSSSDGAVYPKVVVHDIRADGICAHGSINWKHDNGNTYFDTGMWVCGAGTSKSYTKGARNWRDYASVSMSASVDRGPVASAHLADFSSMQTTPQPGGTGVLGPRRTGGKCDSDYMTDAVAKGKGTLFKTWFTPTWRARSYGRFRWKTIWADLKKCAPFPPLQEWQIASLQQQLRCHAYWAVSEYTGGGDTWDLEGWLAPIDEWLIRDPVSIRRHECNWKLQGAGVWG
jgi:hypothetical protein